MNLLRVAIASLLLPAGAQVQAGEVSIKRMDALQTGTAPSHSGAFGPNVSKVPISPGPVPIPYPNVVPGAAAAKDRAPVTTVIKRDLVPIKKEVTKIPGVQQGGTVVGVPAVTIQGGSVEAGGLRLNPLDNPRQSNADQSGDDAQLSRNVQSISDISKTKNDEAQSIIQNMK